MINRLYIQNFRCIESTTLDFSASHSALIIGRNGTGKSSVLAALAILQGICRSHSRVDKLLSKNDFSFNKLDRLMRFEVDVLYGGQRFEYSVAFDWPEHFREARILEERLVVDGQPIFSRDLAKIVFGETRFNLDWHVFAIASITEPAPRRYIENFRNYLAALFLLAPDTGSMSGFSDVSSDELEADASNYASCLRALLEKKPAAYGPLDQFLKSMMPDFSSIEHSERGKDGKQLIVVFRRSEGTGFLGVEFDSLSDGEKCYFLGAWIFASTAVGFPVICVWDELDRHLSPSEIGQFTTALIKVASNGGQLIATSHHPETIRKFSDDNILVLSRKSHLDPTLSSRLSDVGYTGDLIDAIILDSVSA